MLSSLVRFLELSEGGIQEGETTDERVIREIHALVCALSLGDETDMSVLDDSLDIAFQTGDENLFMKNASLLGIDLSDIDFAVLSHAHYDHGNGFVPLFEQNKQVRLFAKRLKDTHAGRVFTGHCTGEDAFRILKEELGDSISQFYAGLEIVM